MRTTWQDLMAAGGPIIADGGMGTMLFSRGLERGTAPELWNVERPDDVRSIHRAYIQAGAQIILTNSFGGSRYRLALHDQADRAVELNTAAAQLALMERLRGEKRLTAKTRQLIVDVDPVDLL